MPVTSTLAGLLNEFERAFDEVLDEMLIGRWRGSRPNTPRLRVVDLGDSYEVRLETGLTDPATLEVEVTARLLNIKARGAHAWYHAVNFPVAVEIEKVRAAWSARQLVVTLPKRLPSRR